MKKLLLLFFSLYALVFVESALAQNSPVLNLPKALIPHAQHKVIAGKDTVIESDTSKEN